MKKFKLNKLRNFLSLNFFLFIVFQFLLIVSLSIYRNVTYSEYNSSFLEEDSFSFNNNLEVCNLIYSDIKPKLIEQYLDYEINLNSDKKYLSNDIKSIRCISTVSYIEISESSKEVNVYIGTNKKVFNYLSFILLLLFLNYRKYHRKKFHYILILIYHFVSYNFFYSALEWYEVVYTSLIRSLLFVVLDFLIFNNFYDILKVNKNLEYRKELDGLRAFSVIFVILNHLDHDLIPLGYLGVDIFFVLSGYVITSSLIKNKNQKLSNFLTDFYVKRFKRLYPTLFTTVIFTYLLLYKYDYYFLSTFITGLFSLIGLSNLFLYNSSLEYFSTTAKYNGLLHTWSLGIEEQFYLIYPFILFYFIYSRKNKELFKYFLLFIFSLSLIYFLFIFESNFNGAYYLPHARIWQILLGAIIYVFQRKNRSYFKFDKNLFIVSFIVLYIIFGEKLEINPHLIISLLTALLLIKSVNNNYSEKILSNRLLTNIGVISYALYLWHLPFFTIKYWKEFNFFNLEVEILLILLFSLGTFYFIDIPIRVKNLISRYKKANILIFFVAIFSIVVLYTRPFESLALGVDPEFDETPVYKLLDCHLPENVENIFDKCLSFNNEKRDLVLLGDSHVTNHYFSISTVNNDKNVSLLIDWSFIGTFVGQDLCFGNRTCTDNGLEDYLKTLNKNLDSKDVVVLSFSSSRVNPSNSKIFSENLEKLISVILDKNSTLILVDDIPIPCSNIDLNYDLEVIVKRNYDICKIEKEFSKEKRGVYSETIKTFSNEENIIYVDPHDYLCEENFCNLNFGNILLYADTSPHFTKSGSDYLNEFWVLVNDKILEKTR